MSNLFRTLLIATAVVSIAGCFNSEATRQQQRQVRETAAVSGTVAGVPVEVRAESQRIESTAETEHRETTVPALSALAQAAPAILGPAAGAGMLGPLAGALGLGAAALAWWRGRQTTGALGRVVAGIEAAKSTLPAPAVDTLHGALSRRLDAADKARIRRLKLTAT